MTTLAFALAALGAGEWIREDLRKPFVIGGYMYVNAVRVAPPAGAALPAPVRDDAFLVDALNRTGVLKAARWSRVSSGLTGLDQAEAEGRELFRLLCTSCHSVDGHLAVRPFLTGKSQAALTTMLSHLDTWRGRRMPPFVGTEGEKAALAIYLARLGGGALTPGPAESSG